MAGTLLAVGSLHHFEKMEIDLILLSGCSSYKGWEHTFHKIWGTNHNTSIVALGSDCSQNSFVEALLGHALSPDCPVKDNLTSIEINEPDFAAVTVCSVRSALTSTLTLFE